MTVNKYQTVFDQLFDKLYENVPGVLSTQPAKKDELKQITKKISQLIAKSWLPDYKNIKETFLYGSQEDIRKLLKENDINIPDLGDRPTQLTIDWDTFYGDIKDRRDGNTVYWEWTIGYPPRPYYDVTDEELKKWVDNDDPNQTFPESAYIPLTF